MKPSAGRTFRPLSPALAIRLNDLISTMTTEAEKIGACCGLTKYPCNRRHQILLRCSSCNTHIECGVSFLQIYWEIQLWPETFGDGVNLVWKKIPLQKDDYADVQVESFVVVCNQKRPICEGKNIIHCSLTHENTKFTQARDIINLWSFCKKVDSKWFLSDLIN